MNTQAPNLPTSAAAKLALLRNQFMSLNAVSQGAEKTHRAAITPLDQIDAVLNGPGKVDRKLERSTFNSSTEGTPRFARLASDRGAAWTDTDRAVRADAVATAEAARIGKESARAAASRVGSMIANLEGYVRQLGEPPASIPLPAVPKGDPELELKRIRKTVADLEVAIAAVKEAPPPVAELKALASAYVDALATEGTPKIADMLRGDATEPELPRSAYVIGGGEPDRVSLPVLAWVMAPMFKDRLHALIDEQLVGHRQIAAKSRADDLTRLRRELLHAERVEEAIIAASHRTDGEFIRRLQPDARAVLGLADSAPVPAWRR